MDDLVLAHFDFAKISGRVVGAACLAVMVVAAPIMGYEQFGQGKLVFSIILMLALALGGTGKWMLYQLVSGWNCLMRDGRAIYTRDGNLVVVAPVFLNMPLNEIASVSVVIKGTDQKPYKVIRIVIPAGPQIVPPGTMKESYEQIADNIRKLI